MESRMTAVFDRMERGLAVIIDSTARYNSTPSQAQELINAEQDLYKALEELHIHQQNHARIQHLRSVTQSLDNQIKDTLTQLAQARKELKDTPATSFPSGPGYQVMYQELLDMARRISRTTLPNAHVLASHQANPPNPIIAPDSGADTPAAATPVAGTPNGAGTPQVNGTGGAGTPAMNVEPSVSQQANNTTLPEGLQAHINPLANVGFEPWPAVELLRQGALANIQYLTDKGINPQGYDPAAEEARKKQEEEEAKEREEKERLEREETERRYREQRERARAEEEKASEEAAKRASVSQAGESSATSLASSAPPPPQQQQPKQFQFMGADDDDDDSD